MIGCHNFRFYSTVHFIFCQPSHVFQMFEWCHLSVLCHSICPMLSCCFSTLAHLYNRASQRVRTSQKISGNRFCHGNGGAGWETASRAACKTDKVSSNQSLNSQSNTTVFTEKSSHRFQSQLTIILLSYFRVTSFPTFGWIYTNYPINKEYVDDTQDSHFFI